MNKKNVIITIISVLILTCIFAFARTTTTDLGLVKPTWTEEIDILDDLNANTDILEAFANDPLEFDSDLERLEDRAGAMWTGNTETGLTITYQDADNTIDAVIGADDIVETMLKFVNLPADEDIATYESTTGDFEWHTLAELSIQPLDAGLTSISGLTTAASTLIYTTALDTYAVLGANATATNKWLRQVSSGAPSWEVIADGDVPNDITIDLATLATTFTCTDNESEALACPILFVDGATGAQGAETDGDLTYNPSTGTVTSTIFAGALTGNSTTTTTASAGDAAVDFFGAGVDAVTDATECTDIEGTGLAITTGVLNMTVPAEHIDSDMYVDASIDHEHLAPDVISGMTDVTSADADYILIWDVTDSALKKVDMGEVRGTGGFTTFSQFDEETAWRVYYSDSAGDITELALGADGTYLKSNGAAAAPTFATPAGAGDVVKVGTPVNDQVGVWTGDGTIEGHASFTYASGTGTVTATAFSGNITGANAVDSNQYTDASIDHEHLAPDVVSGLADVTSADADYILIWDVTDSALKKCDMGEVRGAGGGDVTKVGTPVNNQIGVWTGDGTMEGDANLTYDGTTLVLGTGQINFPDAQNASADVNTLDDYEEGTWTIGISFGGGTTGITYGTQIGYYTKIGNRVFINGSVILTSKGTDTGVALITGLPFTCKSGTASFCPGSLRIDNLSFADTPSCYVGQGTTVINLNETSNGGIVSTLNDVNFANDTAIMVYISYIVE